MIYFDNAATTGVKPPSVISAVNNSLKNFSVNPGRGGYQKSTEAAAMIFDCRKKVMDLVDSSSENSVCFTQNCTHAINSVLYGVLKRGDHIIISSLEHNAVVRPIYDLFLNYGITYSIAKVSDDSAETLNNFKKLVRKNTRMIFVTAASNVIGRVLPLKEIGLLCKEYGLLFAVDGAQGVGILPISMKEMNIDYLCIAPHKGLYAPMGIGVLVAEKEIDNVLIKGGTGVNSISVVQPVDVPERLESGTVNLPGIVGIRAGIEFISAKGLNRIYSHEMSLCRRFYDELVSMGAEIYTERPIDNGFAPVVSFNIMNRQSEDIGVLLSSKNIAVRCGLHCAPLAHKQIGTLERGTVRFSPSAFNKIEEVDMLIFVLKKSI